MPVIDNRSSIRDTYHLKIVDVATGNVTTDSESVIPNYATWYENKTTSGEPRQPSGWRNPSPYRIDTATQVMPRGEMQTLYGQELITATGPYGGFDLTNIDIPSESPALRSRAEVDALLKLKDQAINLGQAFAERRATADLLGDTASRIARAYSAARKGRMKDAASHLGASWRKSPSNWLELQYGWKPLLSDVYGSAQRLAQTYADLDKWRITVKGTASEVEKREWEIHDAQSHWRISEEVSQKSFVRLDYWPGNTFVQTLGNLGVQNPLVILWELVPFSFVVDWALPIGDWLNSLDAAVGFEFKAGSHSQITKKKRSISPLVGQSGWHNTIKNDMHGGRCRRTFLRRDVYMSSPLPRPPVPKNPLSLGHMANGLSLLASAFGKGR